jgi:hypothetical protein
MSAKATWSVSLLKAICRSLVEGERLYEPWNNHVDHCSPDIYISQAQAQVQA